MDMTKRYFHFKSKKKKKKKKNLKADKIKH